MKISWVLADNVIIDPTVDISALKNIGPLWGGWKTWRSCSTDNVVCHDVNQARSLISSKFHNRCNLHVPDSAFQNLGRPDNVKLYQGEFNRMVDNPDDIVSMHLATGSSDVVLLLGFDLTVRPVTKDKLQNHKWHNYKSYFRQIIRDSESIQWVLLDQSAELEDDLKEIPNLQFDTLANILSQF